tara:strand:+ start:8654 stop:8935 length:282 start_codon:yes stop_codon:yes gene_type:complete
MEATIEKLESEACEVLVHQIKMGDVDDPDVMVAAPIYEWQQTESGKYIMEHSNPTAKWIRGNSPNETYDFGHTYNILAYLTEQELTYWKLKYE